MALYIGAEIAVCGQDHAAADIVPVQQYPGGEQFREVYAAEVVGVGDPLAAGAPIYYPIWGLGEEGFQGEHAALEGPIVRVAWVLFQHGLA